MLRIALLISGGGTTAGAIVKACQDGSLENATSVCVIASTDKAEGIVRLKELGIATTDIFVIDPKVFENKELFGEAILEVCNDRQANFVGQYGWMCLTPANVIRAFKNMMVNQHPGPLDPGRPDFGGKGMFGKRVQAARMLFVKRTNRDFWTEATAQRVAESFDEGAVVNRKQVPILENDTVESIAERMLPFEHEIQIETLSDFVNNSVKELVRRYPLIKPGELSILEECKQEAIKMYPKG